MKQITFADRLRYQFDNTMSKGTIALIGWLFVVSAVMILCASLVVIIGGLAPAPAEGGNPSVWEVIWMSAMRAMDAGTVAGDTGSWTFRLTMLAITLGGIFVVSILIGVLTSGIEGKLEELRKGRSFVVEQNHTVILGWSPQIFTIIAELVIANSNQGGGCIAILAEKDKVEMEDEIRAKLGRTGRTRIVCRTGSPIDMSDLEIINPHSARSIIILADDSPNPDSHVIKTTLALINNPRRRPQPYHLVTEVRHPKNVEIIRAIGGQEVEPILAPDLISRITVQTCRQSGLSVVYSDLLDFSGDEIYFQSEPGLVGQTFGQALLAYEDSAVIGLCSKDGQVRLNPPVETVIEAGDQIIAISQDDDTIRLSGQTPAINTEAICPASTSEEMPVRTLILGWNWRAPLIISELDHYVPSGSEVMIVADTPEEEVEQVGQSLDLRHLTVSFRTGDTTDRRTLDELSISTFQHVIVLSYSDQLEPQDADSQTLITLLHLRAISEQSGDTFSIVSEMLDVRNRELAEVTRADDFIVSDKLVSLLLTQISENKKLAAVFADLFDPEGCELYLKPAANYVAAGQPVNFYTIVEAARQRGETAIGYRLRAQTDDAAQAYGVRVNPAKSKAITLSADDRIIVLAES
ncbi:MAG: potassium transporter TrkA [Anaerolineae bacterium]|nr:potassium transporter TrkA [Anaerolineales bacterium]MCQ3974962.1 potassium transporter TrkA [Anaerolineae bacterium]